VITLITRWLPRDRKAWARALDAEYGAIDGAWPRVRFAIGCIRTVAVSLVLGRRSRALSLGVVAGGVAVFVIALYGQWRVSASPSTGGHGPIYTGCVCLVGAAVLAVYVLLALREACSGDPASVTSRRYGVIAGGLIGAFMVVASTPAVDALGRVPPPVTTVLSFGVVLGASLLAGRWAARSSGAPEAGHRTGLWAGLTAGTVLIVGLLSLTLWAGSWLTRDPATIHAYRDSVGAERASYVTHFRTVDAYVRSENEDTAVILGLFFLPVLATVGAAAGGWFAPGPRTLRPSRQ
jgi:hypothetical protein